MARTKKTVDKIVKGIEPVEEDVTSILAESMTAYARDVILERAIPDARDGLKPVQRHILWVMHKNKLDPMARHLKTNTVVGNVMPFHAHGDSSIKDAMDCLSQNWVLNLPLIDFQGNNGSMDGSGAAAGRYTHVRQSKEAALLLERVDTGAAVIVDNYDSTAKEPQTLPARFPVVMTNGALGIAIGVSTAVMPHNVVELLDACIKLVDNENMRLSTLAGIIKGPDFPTGGYLVNSADANLQEITEGSAKYIVRGKAEIVEGTKAEPPHILITQIPWDPWKFGSKTITTTSLIESMDSALDPIKGLGITRITDESEDDTTDVKIKVFFKRTIDTGTMEHVLQHLYDKSLLQTTLSCTNMVICDGKPRVMPMRDYLVYFNHYRLECLRRIWQYDVDQLALDMEISRADIVAFSDPDGLMAIAKASHGRADMVKRLMEKYELTQRQAEHIAGMPLYRFNDAAKLLKKTQEQLKKQLADTAELEKLLSDEKAANKALIADLRKTKSEMIKLGHERKTEIIEESVKVSPRKIQAAEQALIVDKKCVVVMDSEQKVFRIGESAYANQNANGKMSDSVVSAYPASTKDWAYFVFDNGQTVGVRVDNLDTGNLDATFEPLSRQLKKLDPSTKLIGGAIADCNGGDAKRKLVMVSEKGYVKAIDMATIAKDAARARKNYVVSKAHGLRASGDKLIMAFMVDDDALDKLELVANVECKLRGKMTQVERCIPFTAIADFHQGLAGSGQALVKCPDGQILDAHVKQKGDTGMDAAHIQYIVKK